MRRPLDIAEDIVGVGEFKTHASAYLRRVKQTRGPVVITQNGRATAVVVSAERYLELENREWVRDQIREGIESAEHGPNISATEMEKRLRARIRSAAPSAKPMRARAR